MTTVGIIGSGAIGGVVAKLAVGAGYDVVLSNSRGPQTLAGLVASLGPNARAATAAEATVAGDIIVISVPPEVVRHLPVAGLAGKVVLSANNPTARRDGKVAEFEKGNRTSSENEQELLAGARLVKAFNTIFYKHLESLARPVGDAHRSALPIAGDDAAAKRIATEFLDRIGYDVVDVGTLADSWRIERNTPAWASPYGSYDDQTGTPAGREKIKAALAATTR